MLGPRPAGRELDCAYCRRLADPHGSPMSGPYQRELAMAEHGLVSGSVGLDEPRYSAARREPYGSLGIARAATRDFVVESGEIVSNLPPRSLRSHEQVERGPYAWVTIEQAGGNEVDLAIGRLEGCR